MNTSILFNLHEVLIKDNEEILCVETFLFLGIKIIFLAVIQPFIEREDLFILGKNSTFGMQCRGFVVLNWIEVN